MNKPQPKQEITIAIMAETQTGALLYIWAITNDATAWIDEAAPQFGRLHSPDKELNYTLSIPPMYDATEVKAYLEGMGKDSDKP